MSRSADQVLGEMLALLPTGFAWPHAGKPAQAGLRAPLLAAVLRPMATGIADLEAAAAAAMDEIDPRTASVMLADFERLLGPDPCGRDIADLPLSERSRLAHARYTARGGASRAYFYALAAAHGVPITITEMFTSQVGAMECGDELVGASEPFTWIVTLPLGQWSDFEVGANATGDLLYSFEVSDLECEIRRRAPAHTEPIFYYVEAA